MSGLAVFGSLRTLTLVVVTPVIGITVGVMVGGSGVVEGRGVSVGGKVAVMICTVGVEAPF